MVTCSQCCMYDYEGRKCRVYGERYPFEKGCTDFYSPEFMDIVEYLASCRDLEYLKLNPCPEAPKYVRWWFTPLTGGVYPQEFIQQHQAPGVTCKVEFKIKGNRPEVGQFIWAKDMDLIVESFYDYESFKHKLYLFNIKIHSSKK